MTENNNLDYVLKEIYKITSKLDQSDIFNEEDDIKFRRLKIELDIILLKYGISYYSYLCKNLSEYIESFPLTKQSASPDSLWRTSVWPVHNGISNIASLIKNKSSYWFWDCVDLGIQNNIKKLFQNDHYHEVIKNLGSFVENQIKIIYHSKTGKEDTGITLIGKSFSFDVEKNGDVIRRPIIALNLLKTVSDRDEQTGYLNLFLGFISAIRNVYTHTQNMNISREAAIEKILFVNMLIQKLNSRIQ